STGYRRRDIGSRREDDRDLSPSRFLGPEARADPRGESLDRGEAEAGRHARAAMGHAQARLGPRAIELYAEFSPSVGVSVPYGVGHQFREDKAEVQGAVGVDVELD